MISANYFGVSTIYSQANHEVQLQYYL